MSMILAFAFAIIALHPAVSLVFCILLVHALGQIVWGRGGEGERRAQHSAEILGCKISGVALPLPSLGWTMTPPYMFLFLQCNCVHQPFML